MQAMKVEEFRMFIHSPFATNIHLDARQMRNLKTVIARRPLSFTEFYILNSLWNGSKTKDELIKELRQKTKITSIDISLALKNLESTTRYLNKSPRGLGGTTKEPNAGFLKNLQESRYATIGVAMKFGKRPAKVSFSITEEGRKKLENTHKDKDYYEIDPYSEADIANANHMTRVALENFWDEINAERNIDSYRFYNRVFLKQEEISFFSDEDRPVLLAIFPFDGFRQKLVLKDGCPEADLIFENNTIFIYACGVGIFSSEVIVRYSDDINEIKDKLEVKVKEIIQENFKNQGSEIKLDEFNNSIKCDNRFRLVDSFKLESARVAKPAWTHIIYWFYGNEFFRYDSMENRQNLLSDFRRDFTDLLEQSPHNTVFLQNCLVFYGWGRSLILTDKPDESRERWVRNKVNLVELGQFSCFGQILLDYLLQKILAELTGYEQRVDQPVEGLQETIELIDDVRPASIAFLQEFQCGINTILQAGAPFLVETLESHWRLDKVEESIRNKLDSLNSERSAREQSVITQKQDRTNLISSAFTIMGIASVTAAFVGFSPLEGMVKEVTIFLGITIGVIVAAIFMISRWHRIKQWFYYKSSSRKSISDYRKEISSLEVELREGRYRREQYLEELGKLKRKAKDLLDKAKINRSQYAQLEKEIKERYLY
jgi:hypothetical protein